MIRNFRRGSGLRRFEALQMPDCQTAEHWNTSLKQVRQKPKVSDLREKIDRG